CSRKGNKFAMLWEIDIYPAPGQPDRLALQVAADAAELGLASGLQITAASGYLLQGNLQRQQVQQLAEELFADRVLERALVSSIPEAASPESSSPDRGKQPLLVHVLPKPGVMDPVAQSVQEAIADFGFSVEVVRTLRKFWLSNL